MRQHEAQLSLPTPFGARLFVPSTHSRECQREHWAVHKLCCGKTYDEVCAGKKAVEDGILADAAAAAAAAAAADAAGAAGAAAEAQA